MKAASVNSERIQVIPAVMVLLVLLMAIGLLTGCSNTQNNQQDETTGDITETDVPVTSSTSNTYNLDEITADGNEWVYLKQGDNYVRVKCEYEPMFRAESRGSLLEETYDYAHLNYHGIGIPKDACWYSILPGGAVRMREIQTSGYLNENAVDIEASAGDIIVNTYESAIGNYSDAEELYPELWEATQESYAAVESGGSYDSNDWPEPDIDKGIVMFGKIEEQSYCAQWEYASAPDEGELEEYGIDYFDDDNIEYLKGDKEALEAYAEEKGHEFEILPCVRVAYGYDESKAIYSYDGNVRMLELYAPSAVITSLIDDSYWEIEVPKLEPGEYLVTGWSMGFRDGALDAFKITVK